MGYDRNPMNDVAAYAAEKERRRADPDAVGKERHDAAADGVGASREHGDLQLHRSRGILGWIRRALGR
jgi:hypothetical protein